MKLHTKILWGLAAGAIAGTIANLSLGPSHAWVQAVNTYVAGPVGLVFLRLLLMVVVPLVFASIALAVARFGDIRNVGRVGGKAVAFFFATTVLAAAVALVVVNVLRPWERVSPETRQDLMTRFAGDASSRVEAAATSRFGVETFINIVPSNPIRAAADMDLLGIIFFSLFFGAALTLIPLERAKPVVHALEALNDIVTRMIEFAMLLAPFGVAGLIFTTASRFGLDLLMSVAAFVATVLAALLAHVMLTLALLIRYGVGWSPITFGTRIRTALITAFSTSSSSATLPTAIDVAERQLGIPRIVARLVLPLGATMCMNGTAAFGVVTVVFLAELFGVTLSLPQMGIVVLMSVITAVGAAGVPGGSIPLIVGILTMFGVPAEGIAIVLGVDRILDMSRTAVNMCSNLTATAWVARGEGWWKPTHFSVGAVPVDA